MRDDHNNVVQLPKRPRRPPPAPAPTPKPFRPSSRRGSGEPAINWSRAPKAIVLIGIILLFTWLVGGLSGWISGIGAG